MRIGFVTALADEARTLAFTGEPEMRHLVDIAGPGMDNAARAADRLLDRGAEGLISWGTAGGLDPRLGSGFVVLYRAVVDATTARYDCDSNWCSMLAQSLSAMNPALETGFSAEHAVATAVEKAALWQQYGCAAIDMESAAVARSARDAGLPFVALRVIVDSADFELPRAALSALSHGGQPRALPVARELLRRPWEIPALLTLAARYRAALARLRLAARLLRPDFGAK
jgi:adenosylhomocysteine nucleosidase